MHNNITKKYAYLRFNRCFVSQEADSKPDAEVASKIVDSVFANFTNSKNMRACIAVWAGKVRLIDNVGF